MINICYTIMITALLCFRDCNFIFGTIFDQKKVLANQVRLLTSAEFCVRFEIA